MNEDRDLIKRTLAGNRRAFDEIVRRYQDGLFRHLLRLTGRAEDAEDLCQEAFVRFYGALRRFNRARPVAPFLFTIATNVWRERVRGVHPEEHPLDDRQPAGDASVADQVMLRLEHQQILAAVEHLPTEQREVVSLYYDQGLSYREIARVTRAPVGTVSTRLRRALDALRRVIPPAAAGLVIPAGAHDPLATSLVTVLQGQAGAPPSLMAAVAQGTAIITPAGTGLAHAVWTLWKEGGWMTKATYVAVGLAVVGTVGVGVPRLVGRNEAQVRSVFIESMSNPRSTIEAVGPDGKRVPVPPSPADIRTLYDQHWCSARMRYDAMWEDRQSGRVLTHVGVIDLDRNEMWRFMYTADKAGNVADFGTRYGADISQVADQVKRFILPPDRPSRIVNAMKRRPKGEPLPETYEGRKLEISTATSREMYEGRRVEVVTATTEGPPPRRAVTRFDAETGWLVESESYDKDEATGPWVLRDRTKYQYNLPLPVTLARLQLPDGTRTVPAQAAFETQPETGGWRLVMTAQENGTEAEVYYFESAAWKSKQP